MPDPHDNAKASGGAVRLERRRRGRPAKGDDAGPSSVHSVRIQDSVWDALKRAAAERELTVNGALQQAVIDWIERA